jgi:hypothetical protein
MKFCKQWKNILEKEQNREKSGATRDAEFEISLSSEDINKIEEKIKNEDDSIETQNNNNIASGVILFNTCANCDIKFIPKNSMTYETLCGLCVGKKQNDTGMVV